MDDRDKKSHSHASRVMLMMLLLLLLLLLGGAVRNSAEAICNEKVRVSYALR